MAKSKAAVGVSWSFESFVMWGFGVVGLLRMKGESLRLIRFVKLMDGRVNRRCFVAGLIGGVGVGGE